MMKIKRVLAIAAAALTGMSAYAVPVGNLSNGATTIGGFRPVGNHLDTYEFTVTGAATAVGAVVSAPLDIQGLPGIEFKFDIVGISLSGNGVFVQDNNGADGFSVTADLLGPGTYTFSVLGASSGTLGGAYGGVLSAALVPEPETYAMMLAGLCAVGFMARRRRHG